MKEDRRGMGNAEIGLALACLLVGCVSTSAQTLTRAALAPSHDAEAPATAGNAPTNGLLTQADVTGGSSTTQLGLQAADLFLTGNAKTGYAKVYFRTTVPITQSNASSAASSSATQTAGSKLPPAAVAGLLDPYGGILNLSAGYWNHLAKAYARKTDANGNRVEVPNEGLFLDARGGFKMLNLPDQSSTSPSFGGTSVTPFAATSVALRYAHTVYDGDDNARGLLEASIGWLANFCADASLSSAFDRNLLAKNTYALSGSVAFQLNGNLALTITASPWSSNGSAPDFGKNYQIGVKLLNEARK